MRTASLLGLFVIGCGGGALEGTGTSPTEIACEVTGTMTSGDLLVPDGSFAYARVSNAPTRATVSEEAVLASLEAGGLTLEGSLDRTSALRASHVLALGEDILLPAGTELNVLAARRDHIRIGLGRFAFTLEDGASWRGVPAAEVRCDEIGLSFAYRDDETEAREWTELALPPATGTRWLQPRQSVDIRPRPDAQPAMTLTATDHPYELQIVETRGDFVRVVLQHWTGTVLVGWTEAARLDATAPAASEAQAGILAMLADANGTDYEDCVAETDLDVSVRRVAVVMDDGTTRRITPTALVQVGRMAAGTHFERLETGVDAIAIAPGDDTHVSVAPEAQWLIPRVPVQCTTAHRAGIADLVDVSMPP